VSAPRWGCSAVSLALAFVVLGIAPLSLALRLFGLDAQTVGLGLPAPFPPLAPVASPSAGGSALDLPQQAWMADTTVVYRTASTQAPRATLGPGFPVTITAATIVAGERWDRITWNGPTRSSGGAGWVPHAALSAVGTQGVATGDTSALSASLAAALAPYGQRAGIVAFYPEARQIYASNADVVFPLGDGVRGVLEADLLSSPLAASPALAGQPLPRVTQAIAAGDPATLSLAYAQLGGNGPVASFLDALGVNGCTFGPLSWSAASATPRALAQFYAALAGLTPPDAALGDGARAQALAALAPSPETSALAGFGTPLPQKASVLLVLGSAQADDGWSMNAAGVLSAPSGLRYVAGLAVRGQPSPAAAQALLGTLLGQLAAVAGQ
jgi:hypothetical protein